MACSGGADSLALLALAADAGVGPVAAHVDHGIRPGAGAESLVVERAARRLGAGFRAERVTVAPGPNLEARARSARYAALERVRRAVGASVVATGHTADDQAETVLVNVLRGAATDGLAGMAARRGTIVRPLLGLRRADTHAVCRARGLDPVVDPMNADPAYRRVFVRREVLPALERAARRDLVPVLARQAEVLRAESELLDELASDALLRCGGTELRAAGARGPARRAGPPRRAALARIPAGGVRRGGAGAHGRARARPGRSSSAARGASNAAGVCCASSCTRRRSGR